MMIIEKSVSHGKSRGFGAKSLKAERNVGAVNLYQLNFSTWIKLVLKVTAKTCIMILGVVH